jgi:predicted phosphodiesterase
VSLADEAEQFAEEQRCHSLRRDNDRLKSELKAANDKLLEALTRLDVLEGVDRLNPEPPKWTMPKRTKSDSALVVAMLSDTHWDIIVRPEDVAGVNEYNRTVATERTKSWATKLAALPQRGPSADHGGLILLWAGDMMNGPIDQAHMVDAEDTTLGTLLYWSEQAAAAIKLLAESYGRVHIPVVVGNHGRQTLKVRTNLKARDNLDWHLAHLVRRQLVDDKRITWQIDEASDAEFMVFDRRHVVTHGDQARGGGGIGGIWPPLMKLTARKQQRQAGLGRPFDTLWMGHWHTPTFGAGDQFIVNGSLIGPDGYSVNLNLPLNPPEQVATIVTPRGIEWRTAIAPA